MLSRQGSFGGTFADSEDAEDSESPRPLRAEGPKRVQASLARRLTQELVGRDLGAISSAEGALRRDPRDLAPSDEEDSSRVVNHAAAEPVRYPGARGLPAGGSDEDDESSSKVAIERLRMELSSMHAGSFSAPTSPETLGRRRRRMNKVGTVLGLSDRTLREETVRVRQDMATRLLQENESYVEYVEETVLRPRTNSGERSPRPTTLTSADIPLEKILKDPVHRKTFRMHAESNFCAEPLLFWERVNEYKMLDADAPESQKLGMANNIWKNFLDPAAETQLNVREALSLKLKEALDEQRCSRSMFDAIQQEAYSTMQFALYPDYLAYLNASCLAKATLPIDSKRPAAEAAQPPRRLHRSNSISISTEIEVPTLRECLTQPEYSGIFKDFAITLLCGENIEFWRQVAAFQSLRDPELIAECAHDIWAEFLSPTSPTELNVGSKTRKAIRYHIENDLCTASTFNDAQREIYKLISLDVYPKEFENLFAEKKKQKKAKDQFKA